MSIRTTIAAIAFAALATVGSAGVIGAAVVGSAMLADQAGYYDYGYRHCGEIRQFDASGSYVGVRGCNY